MPLSKEKAQKFFNELVKINDRINQQIPLAANRFEEFECPLVDENEHDVDVQFQMHEVLRQLISMHFLALEELQEAYKEFIAQKRLPLNEPLSPDQRKQMETFLTTRTNSLYSKLERTWKASGEFDAISFEASKPKLLNILQSILPQISEKGLSAVLVDEDQLIALHLQDLRDKLAAIITKIRAHNPLSVEELHVVGVYRRREVPHEEDVDQLFTDLHVIKYHPNLKRTINEKALACFEQDALYNIEQLAQKLHARQHRYATRYQSTQRLIEIRTTMQRNQLTETFELLVKHHAYSIEFDEQTAETLDKSQYLQRGLYFELQRFDTGFCGEHASLSLVNIINGWMSEDHRVEKVLIEYGDEDNHVFIAIDRNQDSELNDMTTWGEDAILFDSWHQLVCYAKDIDKQGRIYRSYPKGAEWSSIEFTDEYEHLEQLRNMYTNFLATDSVAPEKREERIIEEYELQEIPQNTVLMAYLNKVVAGFYPDNMKYRIRFFCTKACNDLVQFIPGSHNPIIAIHYNTLSLLSNHQLSLTALEFVLVVILLQLKLHTSYASPATISHESQRTIDIKAMEYVNSTEACIDYLRAASAFKQECPAGAFLIEVYERDFAGINIADVTQLSYAERIKLLLAGIAAEILRPCSKDIEYPSPEFRASLVPLALPAPDSTVLEPRPHSRTEALKRLIALLPDLKVELLPYEKEKIPSRRLRHYGELIKSLQVDFENPEESLLVDQLIDRAHELEIPGFEYIYYAFASRWGVEGIRELKLVIILDKNTEEAVESTYHLKHEANTWSLWYLDKDKNPHPIPVSEVRDLEAYLAKIMSDDKNIYIDRRFIEFLLRQYEGLRPLGFFKTIQKAITDFTLSKSYEEAMQRANELATLRTQYAMHCADDDLRIRGFRLRDQWYKSPTEHRNKTMPRVFGSDVGRSINWLGFDVAGKEFENAPYIPFLRWLKQDKNPLFIETLFRLGLSNLEMVICDMTSEQLAYVARQENYRKFLFYGVLEGQYRIFFRYNFDRILYLVAELKSEAHQLDDSMFSDTALSFEQAFIRYFDTNLPALIYPHLDFNKHHPAQLRLLKEFYRVAVEGTDVEKDVVRSFYYGREDKRDLKGVLKGHVIKYKSHYIEFICLQQFDDKPHQLFADYDLRKFLKLKHIGSYSHPRTLEEYRMIYRLPPAPSLDDLLCTLLVFCEERRIKHFKAIMDQYVAEANRLVMFTPATLKLVSMYQHFSDKVLEALSKASWSQCNAWQLQSIEIDVLIAHYKFCDFYTLFPSEDTKSSLSRIILNRILSLAEKSQQIAWIEQWLFHAADDPPFSDLFIKNKLIDHLVKLYAEQQGQDDGSVAYFNTLKPILLKLFAKLFNRDLRLFMFKFLCAVEAQKSVCDFVGKHIEPAEYDARARKSSKHTLIGLIKVANLFSRKKEDQEAILNYLSSPFSQNSVQTIFLYAKEHIGVTRLASAMGQKYQDFDKMNKTQKQKVDDIQYSLLTSLYYQFWDYTLHERAAIIEQILIPAKKTLSAQLQHQAYEEGLTYIAAKLFPQANDESSEDYLALSIIKSYLKTADNYIRSYLVAALLVSVNEHSGQQSSIGKKFAVLCEYMGPAYVKLAQAIHSHPQTTQEIRQDLAHVKGRANPPPRWTLWRQIAEVLPPEELNKIKRVGQLLGSASYNLALEVTLTDDSNAVLLMLREKAQLTAHKGFEHIRDTINDCGHPFVVRQRMVVAQTIDEAARMSENEMSKEANEQQTALAKSLYPQSLEFLIAGREVKMSIRTAGILVGGAGYRMIDRMYGEEFNSLPDTTPEQHILKSALSKAVVTMELHNILRGGPFDSDRHGNQLRVQVMNPQSQNENTFYLQVGLYDFGEMALESPSEDDLHQLASVLSHAAFGLMYNKGLDQVIAEKINALAYKGQSTHYLMRLRKAMLAMHDFQHYLGTQDWVEILDALVDKHDIHPILHAPLNRLAMAASAATEVLSVAKSLVDRINRFGLFNIYNRAIQSADLIEQLEDEGYIPSQWFDH